MDCQATTLGDHSVVNYIEGMIFDMKRQQPDPALGPLWFCAECKSPAWKSVKSD